MRWLYTLLLYLAMPLVLLHFLWRGLRDSAWLKRWPERFGFFDPPEETAGIVVHAASVGEVNVASSLVKSLSRRFPDLPVCLTTFTPTGSVRVRDLFRDEVFHIYAPLDLPGAVKRFYNRVQPGLLIIMETEIWPNLYFEAASRGIPIMLANARISEHSFGAYRRLGRLTATALNQASRIAAKSQVDAQRLIEIGADRRRIEVTGNLKFDVTLPPSLLEQVREQPGAVLRRGCIRETGAPTLARVRRQGELGHQQQTATGFVQAQVHLSSLVFENPIPEQAIEQAIAAGPVVTLLDPDQDQQPGADPGDTAIIHDDLCPGHTLKQTDH